MSQTLLKVSYAFLDLEGLSIGTVIGIIFGCAIFVIGGILLYRWSNGKKGFSSGMLNFK
jgi:hypothetical protein